MFSVRRLANLRVFVLAGLALGVCSVCPEVGAPKEQARKPAEVGPMFTVLFDNIPHQDGYRTSWGYSCLIRGLEETILFDTGGDGRILLDNMERAGVDPKEIGIIVLSHFHGDHTGGLHALLPRCEGVTVYLLRSFPEAFKNEVRSMASLVVEVSGSISLLDEVKTTGALGFEIPEQSLVVEQEDGLVVVTGCAHPGLRGIVEKAREITAPKPVFLMGGFHLRDLSKSEVTDLVNDLESLGVKAVAPSHCTGSPQRRVIKQMLGDRFLESGAGRVIAMEEMRGALE
ncbi:MAG: MBL fold metallo-hydrolase [Candidatus Eisenbacteria sp.]|nr:MBL fold metallo-hydrolase [Candidatus Eisenbacteria bacterium]